jgi:hypothetical protein
MEAVAWWADRCLPLALAAIVVFWVVPLAVVYVVEALGN